MDSQNSTERLAEEAITGDLSARSQLAREVASMTPEALAKLAQRVNAFDDAVGSDVQANILRDKSGQVVAIAFNMQDEDLGGTRGVVLEAPPQGVSSTDTFVAAGLPITIVIAGEADRIPAESFANSLQREHPGADIEVAVGDRVQTGDMRDGRVFVGYHYLLHR